MKFQLTCTRGNEESIFNDERRNQKNSVYKRYCSKCSKCGKICLFTFFVSVVDIKKNKHVIKFMKKNCNTL